MTLHLKSMQVFNKDLESLPDKKLIINTINAHCYNIAQEDPLYAKALLSSDVLLPDGVSISMAFNFLNGKKIKKIAGADLFYYEMNRLNRSGGKCFFLGSTISTLKQIKEKASSEFPNVEVDYHSPPYVPEFSQKENAEMIDRINAFKPDVLFVGMTAPKQEKWAYKHRDMIETGHVCSIGAVFDFYAGNIKRAPVWMIDMGLEWFYRLIKEPKRLWRRYIIGNILFIYHMGKEKLTSANNLSI